MEALQIKLEPDEKTPNGRIWDDLNENDFVQAQITSVAGVENATRDCNPGVIFRLLMPDGSTVLAGTTLRLFLMAAAAFRGKYGEP